MNPMEENVKKIEAQLKGWTASIDEFAANAQKSNEWARIDLRQGIDDLKVKRALLQTKLDEFEAAGSAGREGLSKNLERAWKDLEDAFEDREEIKIYGQERGHSKECKR